jgi:predicted metal-dependent hydrolase
MSALYVRRLLIDLEQPVDRHWCGGDAFLTAWFNALSMSFPIGEQFFIDAVRDGFKQLPPSRQPEFQADVQGFVGQEATHRRIHSLFNAQIARHGLVNAWEPRAVARLKATQGADVRHALGITAANEHFTALFAEWLLSRPSVLDGADPRLKTMWLWHSAEEAEHKSVAFDLYLALGGSHEWRVKWMRRVTVIFLLDTLRQTLNNLQRDGSLWRWNTWRSAARHLLGRDGLFTASFKHWRQYFNPAFHPNQHGSELADQWLQDNASSYKVVGAG